MFMVEFGVVEYEKTSMCLLDLKDRCDLPISECFKNSTTPNSTMNISYMMRSPMMSFKEFKAMMEIIDQKCSPK